MVFVALVCCACVADLATHIHTLCRGRFHNWLRTCKLSIKDLPNSETSVNRNCCTAADVTKPRLTCA